MIIRPVATVNLGHLVKNWQLLDGRHQGMTGAVVKADAYGLGVAPVAQALAEAGCRHFFVATLQEAITLRAALPHHTIAVFQGMLKGEASYYDEYDLRPILNNVTQLQAFVAKPTVQPAILHIDSGMERLGLNIAELSRKEILDAAHHPHINMLMTHYACASDIHHPLNKRQYDIMQQAQRLLPHLRTSYANSAGHFLPEGYQGQLTRPGCALYGINPCDNIPNPMHPVVTLTAPILQCRTIYEDTTLGYGATAKVSKGMRTITISIGYADGIHRTASHGLYAYLNDYRLPLLGRVTMDALCFDATHVPLSILDKASHLVLMDERQTVNDLAHIYGTIGYEVLTGLGQRIQREYK